MVINGHFAHCNGPGEIDLNPGAHRAIFGDPRAPSIGVGCGESQLAASELLIVIVAGGGARGVAQVDQGQRTRRIRCRSWRIS